MRLGILTSGGDAPGMNAVIAGAALAMADAEPLIGLEFGFAGLLKRRPVAINPALANDKRKTAGTMLGTGRSAAFLRAGAVEEALRCAAELDLNGLVVVGGNGSLAAARSLAAAGDLCVAFVPATIDNDIPGTTTIGFSSAVEYGCEAVARLRVTAQSLPGRGFLLQVLGGDTGYLASAIADQTTVPLALIPEQPFDLNEVARQLATNAAQAEAIAVVSEGVGDAVRLAEQLAALAGIRIHPTILGHTQRAATPTRFDISAGAEAGALAIREIRELRSSFIVLSAPPNGPQPLLAATPLLTEALDQATTTVSEA